ncbi:hypothetical protein [Leptospira interrogans]|uniref:hypothetical protein n=2 Tax=Leptospira interrogans TaxID=173 RepID=UPI00027858C0|nr:hypothetical protein [Leptospira interrogans]EJP16631.1 hypothetical protein LEP1GSC080_0651 [Leptospira interrogans str. FPW2026]
MNKFNTIFFFVYTLKRILKWYRILSLKIFILSSIIFLIINCVSDFQRAREFPVKSNIICDNFGNIDSKTVPLESIYFDESSGKKMVAVAAGRYFPDGIPFEHITNAIQIRNKKDLIEFQRTYSEVCFKGEPHKPPIYDKIEIVKSEKLKLNQGILKNINIKEVVEVESLYEDFSDGIYSILRSAEQDKNFSEFALAHFNDMEYNFYNSWEYPGDEFSFNELKDKLHQIKKSKKYILIQVPMINQLSALFDWNQYDFSGQNFSTKNFFRKTFSSNVFGIYDGFDDRFNILGTFQVKIPKDYAQEFYRSWIIRDTSLGKQYLSVELLFKIENSYEDKIVWDCGDRVSLVKPALGIDCKVRMDLRRKKLNLTPIRYKFENIRENKVFHNY